MCNGVEEGEGDESQAEGDAERVATSECRPHPRVTTHAGVRTGHVRGAVW